MASKRERKSKRSLSVPWSQLPIDVLDNIIKRLELPVDAVSFSAVCKLWRHVALGMHMSVFCKLPMHHFIPKKNPLPMLLHPGFEGPNTHRLYSLNEKKIYAGFHLRELSNKWIIGSGAGWLATVDTANREVALLNPLTGKKILLPHLSTLPSCDLSLDYKYRTGYWYLRKVIVCSYQGSILVVALVSKYKMIWFCKIGDPKWTEIENSPDHVEDIIMHNGKLYAVNTSGTLYEIDVADPAKVTTTALEPQCRECKYFLVSLCGELVLLVRFPLKFGRDRESQVTGGFKVFKLVEDDMYKIEYSAMYEAETGMQYPRHLLVRLRNLGHHMVFIGYNHSISLDSRVYPRCKGNCIYFADNMLDEYDYLKMRGLVKKLHHDVGIYRMAERKVKHFKYSSRALSPMNMVWLSPSFSSELEMQMLPH